jgi:hypothetical protein
MTESHVLVIDVLPRVFVAVCVVSERDGVTCHDWYFQIRRSACVKAGP